MSTPLAAPLVLVEFTGPAGAGKTTFSRELADLLRKEQISCSGPSALRDPTAHPLITKLQIIVDLALRRAPFVVQAARWARNCTPRIPGRRLRSILNAPFWLSRRTQTGSMVVLLEEGPVHKLWLECLRAGVHQPADPSTVFRSIYHDVDKQIIFVNVAVDPETAAARIEARGKAGWFESRPTQEILKATRDLSALAERFTHAAANAIGARTITISGSDQPAVNAKIIAAFLKEEVWKRQSLAV